MKKDIPMLFKAEMVRALLRLDNPKTQTRRLEFKGKVGDVIWVKETHARYNYGPVFYRADYCAETEPNTVWRPSLFMRRDFSRIDLEVTAVRQERLQDIRKADAIAEGTEQLSYSFSPKVLWRNYAKDICDFGWHFEDPVDSYKSLWTSIHGKASWDANPLVYVITFKRIKPCCSRDHYYDGNCDRHRDPMTELRKELES